MRTAEKTQLLVAKSTHTGARVHACKHVCTRTDTRTHVHVHGFRVCGNYAPVKGNVLGLLENSPATLQSSHVPEAVHAPMA